MRIIALLLATAIAATPALAQTYPQADPNSPRTPLPYDRGYDKPDPRTEAYNAQIRPQVAAANNAVAAATADSGQPYVTAGDETRYQADMASYRAELRAHDRAMADDAVFAARQERAYADAMRAWRVQVADCNAGIRAACRAPAPTTADFW